ncbi:MAG TPA: hypothetical protein VK120_07340 [Sporosarcina sp.]|nr:hypothetical protein [Sporosarcina sp.]
MSNEHGYSWTEAILTLFVLMTIFGTLVPVAVQMQQKLFSKKIETIASELLVQSAIQYDAYGQTFGSDYRNEILFQWEYVNDQLCVSYLLEETEYHLCNE